MSIAQTRRDDRVAVEPAERPIARMLRHWLPVLAPAAVMLAVGIWGLDRAGAMGNDEVATRWAAGLRLARPPQPPREMPAAALIRNTLGIQDWAMFLG